MAPPKGFQLIRLFAILTFLISLSSEAVLAQVKEAHLIHVERGNALYSQAGHSLLRVKSKTKKGIRDLAYNWGVFNSKSANFAWNFYQGTLQYKLQVTKMSRYLKFSRNFKERSIRSYKFNFNEKELQLFEKHLKQFRKDDVKFYTYHVWYNNCATKIRDLVDLSTEGKLKKYLTGIPTNKSFRNYWWDSFGEKPTVGIATALLFNHFADQKLSLWEAGFLPDKLRDGFVQYSKEVSPGFFSDEVLIRPQGEVSGKFLDGRLMLGLLWLYFCGLSLLTIKYRSKKSSFLKKAFSVFGLGFSLIAIGLIGTTYGSLMIMNLWLTSREYFQLSLNLFFLWPTDLFLALLGTMFIFTTYIKTEWNQNCYKYLFHYFQLKVLVLPFSMLAAFIVTENMWDSLATFLPGHLILFVGGWYVLRNQLRAGFKADASDFEAMSSEENDEEKSLAG